MGPQTDIGKWVHSWKYRSEGESFNAYSNRVASVLAEGDNFRPTRDILRDQRFLPGGRIQSAIGSNRHVTPTTALSWTPLRITPIVS